MKNVLVVSAIIISGLSFGQNSKFSLGVNFAPEMAYRTILLKDVDPPYEDLYESIKEWSDESQRIRFGFSTGVTFQYKATEHWTLQSGLSYAEGGYAGKWQTYTDANGNVISDSRESLRIRYIQAPVNILYCFKKSGPQLYAGLGMIPGYLTDSNYKTELRNSNNTSTYTENHNTADMVRFSLSANILAGLKIPVGEKTNLCIEPTFRFGLLSINEIQLAHHLWNSGVNFSYRINL